MLQSAEFTNYQSHEETTIELHPGLNIISGTTDSGKSALLRGILWCVRNRPLGEGFKNWYAAENAPVSVALEFDDGWVIKSRTKKKNMYEVEGGTYEALRSDVPDEVMEVHRLKECNIQTQLQPYFLLQDSPGERGKIMNKLVGLDIIDRISKKINAKVKKSKEDINQASTKVASLSVAIDELPDLSDAEVLLNKIAHAIDEAEKTQEKLNALTRDTAKLAECVETIEDYRDFLAVEIPYKKLISKVEEHQEVYDDFNDLESLLKKQREIRLTIADDKEWLAIEKPHALLTDKIAKALEGEIVAASLDSALDELVEVSDTVDKLDEELKTKRLEYIQILGDAGECPTCHTIMDMRSLSKLAKKL